VSVSPTLCNHNPQTANKIQDEGATAIANALKKNRHIGYLGLSGEHWPLFLFFDNQGSHLGQQGQLQWVMP
jgi:hypothetical protein